MANATDPKLHAVLREILGRLTARFRRETFGTDDNRAEVAFSNAVKSQEWRLNDIPDETLALILVIMVDEKKYTDTLAIYNALIRTNKDFARVMEQYEIWRAMTEAYIFRSKWNTASTVTTKEARKLTREDRDMYMQTLFDHYEMAVTERSTRPKLNERWRTWKRILEHFKRIDKRIQDRGMVEEKEYFNRTVMEGPSVWTGKTGPIRSALERDSATNLLVRPVTMLSCSESPYTISVFNNRFHFLSGFGNPNQWMEMSPEFETDYLITSAPRMVAVAYPKRGARSAYTLVLEYTAAIYESHSLMHMHTIELKDNGNATPTSKLTFNFNVSEPLVVARKEMQQFLITFAASRNFLMAFVDARGVGARAITLTGLVYKYNYETLSYTLVHTMDNVSSEILFGRYAFKAHTFRSNVFIMPTLEKIVVFEILDDGVKTREVEIPSPLQPSISLEVKQINGTVYLSQDSRWRGALDPITRDRVPDTINIGLCDVDKVLSMPEDESYKIRFLPFYVYPEESKPAPLYVLFDSQWLLMVNNVRVVGVNNHVPKHQVNADQKLTLRYFDLEKLDWDAPMKWSWAQKPKVERVVKALVNTDVRCLHFHNGTLIVQSHEGIACYSYCAEEWHTQEETEYMLSSAKPNTVTSSQQSMRSHPTLQWPLRANFEKW